MLDAAVLDAAKDCRNRMAEEQQKLKQLKRIWALRKPVLDAHIAMLEDRIRQLENEIDEIVMAKLR